MELRTAVSPRDVKHYTTERLREEFLIQNLFVPGEIKLVYSHIDRIITGAAVPVSPITLTAGDELRAEYFCQRRELGVINIGGAGMITVDGKVYKVGYKEAMYIGMGSKEIIFASEDEKQPAKFYLNSAPAHKTYPTVLIKPEGTPEEGVVIVKDENKVELGTLEDANHRVICKYILPGQVESCQLEDQTADAIIAAVRRLCPDFKIIPYDEDHGTGLLRHVLVKRGFHSGEVMVVLVTSGPILPSRNNFIAALRRQHPEITTILQNINPYRTSLILGEQEKVLYGLGTIEDTLCGCRFRISARSFYQINPLQTEILYSKAMEFAQLTGNETVIDAYCGIGTIGLIASSHVKNVIGVELNREAVRDAIFNSRLNQIKNARFYCADAGEWMLAMAQEKQKADVVFMDPPRAGSDECFLQSVLTLAPKRIVYISCNPETLARDLKILTKSDYTIEKIQPVDMFPHTHHIETVVSLKSGHRA